MPSLKIVPTSSADIVRDIEKSAKQTLLGNVVKKEDFEEKNHDYQLHNHRMVTGFSLIISCIFLLLSVYLLVANKDLQKDNKDLQITNRHMSITVDDAMTQILRLNRENKNLTDEVRDYKSVAIPHLKNELSLLSEEVSVQNRRIRMLRTNLRLVCDEFIGEKPKTCPKPVVKKVVIKKSQVKKKQDPTKFTASYPLRMQNGL